MKSLEGMNGELVSGFSVGTQNTASWAYLTFLPQLAL